MTQRCIQFLLGLAGLLVCTDALAQAAVMPQCNVQSQDIDFGNYNPNSTTPTDAQATLTVRCKNPMNTVQQVQVCIGLKQGSAGTSVATRKLQSGSNTLNYQLYQNAARSQRWGQFAQNEHWKSNVMSIPVNIGDQIIASQVIYARMPAGQAANPGQYSSSYPYLEQTELQLIFYGGTSIPFSCNQPKDYTMLGGGITPFTVKANVAESCQITLVQELNFGIINSTQTLNTRPSRPFRVSVKCPSGTKYSIALGNGLHSTGPGVRRMRSTSNLTHYITYDIYQNINGSTRWGRAPSGANGAIMSNLTGTGNNQLRQGYGKILTPTAPSVGTYQDTVAVTVTY